MDRHSSKQRSFNMSRVKAKNTKPELIVFNKLEELNIPFEKHYLVTGKPDVAFPDKKIAVFIDGEFWHGRHFIKEKERYSDFWIKKISDNIKRDKRSRRLLKNAGWKVIRIWDKDLKKNKDKEITKLMKFIIY